MASARARRERSTVRGLPPGLAGRTPAYHADGRAVLGVGRRGHEGTSGRDIGTAGTLMVLGGTLVDLGHVLGTGDHGVTREPGVKLGRRVAPRAGRAEAVPCPGPDASR